MNRGVDGSLHGDVLPGIHHVRGAEIGMIGRLVGLFFVNAFGLWLAALIVDGVHFDGNLVSLAGAALVFSIVSVLIKPFVVLLTLPLTIVTFGLFLLVINALMLMLTGAFSRAYSVDDFWAALLGGILISIVGLAANLVIGDVKIRSFRSSGRPPTGGRLGGP
jgi:putative membrane protein